MATSSRFATSGVAAADDRWTPAQAAEYAATRDFLLLQMLSKDRRALAVARRLGVFDRSFHSKAGATRGHDVEPARTPLRRAAQTQTTKSPTGTSAQRRSNERAAKNRAAQEAAATPRPQAATSVSPSSYAAVLVASAPAATSPTEQLPNALAPQLVGGTASSASRDDEMVVDAVDSIAPSTALLTNGARADASATPADAPPLTQAEINAKIMQSFMLRRAEAELEARSRVRAEGRDITRPTTHDRSGEGNTRDSATQAMRPGTRAQQGGGAGGPSPHSGGKGNGGRGGSGRGGAQQQPGARR